MGENVYSHSIGKWKIDKEEKSLDDLQIPLATLKDTSTLLIEVELSSVVSSLANQYPTTTSAHITPAPSDKSVDNLNVLPNSTKIPSSSITTPLSASVTTSQQSLLTTLKRHYEHAGKEYSQIAQCKGWTQHKIGQGYLYYTAKKEDVKVQRAETPHYWYEQRNKIKSRRLIELYVV